MDVERANCRKKVSECTDMEILPIARPIKADREITGLEKLLEELNSIFSSDYVNVQDVQKLMLAYKSEPKHWRKYAKFDRFRYTRNLVDSGNGAFNVMILCWGPGHASAIHDHADSHCFMKLLSGNLEEVRYEWPKNLGPTVKNPCCMNCEQANDLVTDQTQNTLIHCRDKSCECHQNGGTSDTQNGAQNGGRCHQNGGTSDTQNGGQNGGRDGADDNCQNEYYNSDSMNETSRTRLDVNDVCYINDTLGLHRMENPSYVDGAVSLHLYCPPFDSCRVFDSRTGKSTQVKVTFWSEYGKRTNRIIHDADSQ